MRLYIGCNFNLVYCRETEAKKMAKFFGGTPLLAPRKIFETLKKNEGCQSVDKGGGI